MDTGTPAAWNKKGGLGRSGLGAPGSQWGPDANKKTNEGGNWQKQAQERAAANEQMNPKSKPSSNPYSADPSKQRYTVPDGKGGTKTVDGNGNEVGGEEENGGQPKMTHAYGNKNAKMVKARGDLG